MSNFYAGVDVGATTIKIGTFSDKGELIEKWEIPTRKEEQGAYILSDKATFLTFFANSGKVES